MSGLLDGSVVVSRLRDATRGSAVGRGLRTTRDRCAEAFSRSQLVRTADRTGAALGGWVRGSWLYDWLTAEPEPEVIVIDLRETYTVGPIIAALDRVAAWVGPRWRASTPKRLLDGAEARSAALLDDSWTARVLAVALVPPEPPDEPDRNDEPGSDE